MPVRALVVVDVQRDFADPAGSLYVTGGEVVAARIHDDLLATDSYELVVATRDHHLDPAGHFSEQPDFAETWPPHCVAGTPGAELHPDLVGTDEHLFAAVFDKGEHEAAYSGFEGKDPASGVGLGDFLSSEGVTDLDVVGLALDYCVRATALDARAAGLTTRVLSAYTASVSEESGEAAARELESAGVEVVRPPA